MTQHAYGVSMIATDVRMRYQANCACGQWFQLHDDSETAGLDGLDHVREVAGRATRRSEIIAELALGEHKRAMRRAGR